jgi:hypothetical protein
MVFEGGDAPVVLLADPSSNGQRWVAGKAQLVGSGGQIKWSRTGGFGLTCRRQ